MHSRVRSKRAAICRWQSPCLIDGPTAVDLLARGQRNPADGVGDGVELCALVSGDLRDDVGYLGPPPPSKGLDDGVAGEPEIASGPEAVTQVTAARAGILQLEGLPVRKRPSPKQGVIPVQRRAPPIGIEVRWAVARELENCVDH